LNNLAGTIEIASSLNKNNKRSTETRNIEKESLGTEDTDIKNRSIQSQSFFKSFKSSQNRGQQHASKSNIEELWMAIEYQDETISRLINANNSLSK
jgi:hypothetical protein